LECSPGGFRSESKTVLGKVLKARPSWVKLRHQEASQGFNCPRFIQPNKQANIFSPVHWLLESARKLEVRDILGGWRIVWSISAVFSFLEPLLVLRAVFVLKPRPSLKPRPTTKARFFISPKNCIFVCRFFELLKNLAFVVVGVVLRFLLNPPIPLLHPTV